MSAPDVRSSNACVSVVVITFNRSQRLPQCIHSLFQQTHRPLEIIVVDDASTDDTRAVLDELQAKAPADLLFRVEARTRNGGFGRARNTGITIARGDYIAFTDDDCVARPDWVAELILPFSQAEEIVVTGGAVDEPPDPTWAQRAAEGMNFLGTTEDDVPSVVGCNMAYRAAWLQANPFDPCVRYGADEIDRCFEAGRQGLRVRFTPRARLVHNHRCTVSGFLKQQLRRGRGSVWVRRKHGRGLWPNKNWVLLGILIAGVTAATFPARSTRLVLAGLGLLFIAQIVALDLAKGKSLSAIAMSFPLVTLGYVAEFCGALVGLARGFRAG